MPFTTKTLEQMFDHPRNIAVLKSILSREDASTLEEIKKDLKDIPSSSVENHVRSLLKLHVLERGRNPTTELRQYVYYIHPSTPNLQEFLLEKVGSL